MLNFGDFLMIFSRNSLSLGQYIYMGICEKGMGWGGWWKRLKQRGKTAQMAGFRVAVTSTCTHNGPIIGLD